MTADAAFEKIELHLIRVLQTLITERSVSRAAMRLGSTQPPVSAQLRRLRALTGDALLVRAGNAMTPTETALQLLGPATTPAARGRPPVRRRTPSSAASTPAPAEATFRIAASDYLDPLFLPELVAHVKRAGAAGAARAAAALRRVRLPKRLAAGEVDLVIGNWLQPPGELHLGRLISDEIVCLVGDDHPAAAAGWTAERYLAAEHVAPMPFHAQSRRASSTSTWRRSA